MPSGFLQVPLGDLAARSPPSEVSGEPTCTVLGTEVGVSSLLPSISPDAEVRLLLLGSESRMIPGDPVGENEGIGFSIHLHDE